MTLEEMYDVLDHCTYPDHFFDIWDDNGRPVLQVAFLAPDVVTRTPISQKGRKWFLSYYMTKSEIVSTAFKAIMTAVEHEVRENFQYKYESVFGPHFDVDELRESIIAGRLNEDTRSDGAWVEKAA